MDLVTLLHNGKKGYTFLIVQYLGHHSADALSKTCRSMKALLIGNDESRTNDNDGGGGDSSSWLWWKYLVLNTLQQNDKDGTWASNLGNEMSLTRTSCITWKNLSDLVHSNLRKRKALNCLGLSPQYCYTSPEREEFFPTFDVNQNENLCFLMGNNATKNFFKWMHLPYRENVPPGIKRSKRWDWLKPKPKPETNVPPYRNRQDSVRWTDAELRLLSEAGRYSIGRIGDVVKMAVDTIQEETQGVAPLASSGDMGNLEPKLCIEGLGGPVSLPLDPEFLGRVVQDHRCRQSSFGHRRGRRHDASVRMCYEMSLDGDVQVTDPAFKEYLSAPCTENDTLKIGMWSAINELLLPELIRGRRNLADYRVRLKPNKMLVYGKGGKFRAHRDSKHGSGHFGTLVIVLPVSNNDDTDVDAGGTLVLRCEETENIGTDKQKNSWKIKKHKPPKKGEPATWHVFLHGTSHQVQPVKCGYRVALTYQLWFEGENASLVLPPEPRQDLLSLLGRSIQYWVESNAMEELVEFVLPLRHGYSVDDNDLYGDKDFDFEDRFEPLREATLRGHDFWLYRGLLDSLKGTNMELDLEFNGVCLTVTGYPQGVVTARRNTWESTLPLEEQSKVIWLPSEKEVKLVDSGWKSEKNKESIWVACISIHHKRFRCRYGRSLGFSSRLGNYRHPDDVILSD